MFQFPGLAFRLAAEWYIFNVPGCPIRKSADITLVCSSPQLIAAYRVLHRLLEPRHPPCALSCFKKFEYCSVTRPLIEKLFVIVKKNLSNNFFPICQRTYPTSPEEGLRGLMMLRLRTSWPEVTSTFLRTSSCQLLIAYCQLCVEDIGFEPMTPCVQGRCSSQLS